MGTLPSRDAWMVPVMDNTSPGPRGGSRPGLLMGHWTGAGTLIPTGGRDHRQGAPRQLWSPGWQHFHHTRNLELNRNKAISQLHVCVLQACRPHYEHLCGKNMYLNGVCYRFDRGLQTTATNCASLFSTECTVRGIDIVFLIDGSGSVSSPDFQNMKVFMIQIINKFWGRNTNVSKHQSSEPCGFIYFFDFRRYLSSRSPSILINPIVQMSGGTNTVSGMRNVVTGSRTDATKILITITDGESQERNFEEVTRKADAKNIIRYAIGVGGAFARREPRQELNRITSSSNNVFRVDDFNALNGIQSQLEERIFSIEGDTAGLTLGSQSKKYTCLEGTGRKDGSVLYGAVGSYDWSGGFFEQNGHILKFFNMSSRSRDFKGSYLGKSEKFIVSLGVKWRCSFKLQYTLFDFFFFFQIGSYFGSVICSVDLNKNGETDLLLISAPMYQSTGKGGQVFALSDTLNGMEGQPNSRFGASIAEISDLNGDGITDVAVGAPLENNGRGSVYIFNGDSHSGPTLINRLCCTLQRIEASQLSGDLTLFGHSLHGILDLTGDQMPDLTIGWLASWHFFYSLCRSRPVLGVEVTAAFQPEIINTKDEDCAKESKHKMTLCFIMTKVTKDNAGENSTGLTKQTQQANENPIYSALTTHTLYKFLFTPSSSRKQASILYSLQIKFKILPCWGRSRHTPVLHQSCSLTANEVSPGRTNLTMCPQGKKEGRKEMACVCPTRIDNTIKFYVKQNSRASLKIQFHTLHYIQLSIQGLW
uniref:VWFA domain-containing protein n=1 Tax=Erpetoichthys calabaricus TaxID=27687 RepID=A0A8C4TM72_ERPCA